MKAHRLKSKIISELWIMPIVQIACEKVGIARQTFYRWLREDIDFRAGVDEAIECSTGTINDAAESNIIRGIQAKDMKATMYWLDKRHPSFKQSRPVYKKEAVFDPIKHQQMVDMWFLPEETQTTVSESLSETLPEETVRFSAEIPETP